MVFASIASIVFMLAAISAIAQTAEYKVGDRVECDPNLTDKYKKGAVVPYEKNDYQVPGQHRGWYRVLLDGEIYSVACQPKQMRALAGAPPANAANNLPNQQQNQGNNNIQPVAANDKNIYGTRDAETCGNTKAPVRGAITPALAKKYLMCDREGVRRHAMHIVENVKVEVGGGRRFQPQSDLNFSDINVRALIYPIRGSLTSYECVEVDSNRNHSNLGRNCTMFVERKATGTCYKTTFGDWRCSTFGLDWRYI